MEALHIVRQNPTENIGDAIFSISKLEKATKDKTGFESHEAVIIRLVNALGQAALLDV